ncbi:MAG: hypothetical protein E7662_00905 [Ruminococcaceae bacterium]|nr:hypothetical protein [Oscillospiraceae bacterium]
MGQQKNTALVPIAGKGESLHAVFTQITGDEPARAPGILRHVCALFCALSCLICITVVFLIALSAAAGTDFRITALRIAEQAFLGIGMVELTDDIPKADGRDFPFPQPGTSSPAEDESVPEGTASPETGSSGSGGGYPIVQTDLSCGMDLTAMFNETSYTPDTLALLEESLPFPDFSTWAAQYGTDVPYILILHTHGTEAYAPEGADSYSASDSFRSHNTEENVVAVGTAMAQTLEKAGIPVLHCTEMFDAVSYTDAYSLAAAAIRTYLQKYPSIQIILDVHRDSIVRADQTKMQPVTKIGGVEYAQFMIVTGTNHRGADFPRWTDNLNFAMKIQETLMGRSDSLVRAINLRGATFNGQYRSGSLLLEVGSCGNTLSQAKRTGVLAAIAIAEVVKGKCTLTVNGILGESGGGRLTLPVMGTWDQQPKRS